MHPRSYLFLALGSALACAAVIAALGRWLGAPDMVAQTAHVMEHKTAALIARGEPAILSGRLNEWELRWHTAQLITRAPAVAIQGSSHSLGVSAPLVGEKSAMNFSISGASLADYLVTAGILEARSIRPARWVVFVDVWLFDLGADFRAWPGRAEELVRMEGLLAGRASPPLERVFSNNQSAGELRGPRPRGLEPVMRAFDGAIARRLLTAQPAGSEPSGPVLLADGSLPASAEGHAPDPAAVAALARRQFLDRPDRHRYGGYARIDENLWRYFEFWLQHCRDAGSEVHLVLPPYHPAIYPLIIRSPGNQLEAVEKRVRDLGVRLGIPVTGSYDPVRAGLPAELFYDGDHLREDGLRQLLAPVREMSARRP